jgi:hypothetical protein
MPNGGAAVRMALIVLFARGRCCMDVVTVLFAIMVALLYGVNYCFIR